MTAAAGSGLPFLNLKSDRRRGPCLERVHAARAVSEACDAGSAIAGYRSGGRFRASRDRTPSLGRDALPGEPPEG